DAAGEKTAVLMNAYGQPALVQSPLGQITLYHYDQNHNLVGITGPGGRSTALNPDPWGNVTEVIDLLHHRSSAAFVPGTDQLQALRDACGNVTTYTHDVSGNLTSTTNAAGSSARYSYDPAGNVVQAIDNNVQVIRYTYDAHNLLVRKDYTDGS